MNGLAKRNAARKRLVKKIVLMRVLLFDLYGIFYTIGLVVQKFIVVFRTTIIVMFPQMSGLDIESCFSFLMLASLKNANRE